MPKYVDGFVLVVPKKKLGAYKKMAEEGGRVWRKCGALDYKECVIEDARPHQTTFPFKKMTKAKANETVIFAYIVFKSRKHRDQVNAKVMKDPYMNPPKEEQKKMMANMPFDMKRMAYAGFEVLVDA